MIPTKVSFRSNNFVRTVCQTKEKKKERERERLPKKGLHCKFRKDPKCSVKIHKQLPSSHKKKVSLLCTVKHFHLHLHDCFVICIRQKVESSEICTCTNVHLSWLGTCTLVSKRMCCLWGRAFTIGGVSQRNGGWWQRNRQTRCQPQQVLTTRLSTASLDNFFASGFFTTTPDRFLGVQRTLLSHSNLGLPGPQWSSTSRRLFQLARLTIVVVVVVVFVVVPMLMLLFFFHIQLTTTSSNFITKPPDAYTKTSSTFLTDTLPSDGQTNDTLAPTIKSITQRSAASTPSENSTDVDSTLSASPVSPKVAPTAHSTLADTSTSKIEPMTTSVSQGMMQLRHALAITNWLTIVKKNLVGLGRSAREYLHNDTLHYLHVYVLVPCHNEEQEMHP